MATTMPPPLSPGMAQALNSPIEFLPVTRFPVEDPNANSLRDVMMQTQKERQTIQSQPYRTTQLVFPNPKPKPDLVKTKYAGRKPTTFRPLDQRTVVANVNENIALVQRQTYNNPRQLYSDQNVKEAIYIQTGLNYPPQQQQQQQQYMQQQQAMMNRPLQPHRQQYQPPPVSPRSSSSLGPPIHMTPDKLPDFKPQNSPTYRAILEEEGPGTAMAARQAQVAPAKPAYNPQHKMGHNTAPTYNLNSVGGANDRIAQSGSFKRLMYSVMSEF